MAENKSNPILMSLSAALVLCFFYVFGLLWLLIILLPIAIAVSWWNDQQKKKATILDG